MKSFRLFLFLGLAVLLLLSRVCFSAQTQADTVKTLTAPEVKKMITQTNAVLVNTLSSIEFEVQHIPGSINIPVIEMETTDKLPEDKNVSLIFYCMGVR